MRSGLFPLAFPSVFLFPCSLIMLSLLFIFFFLFPFHAFDSFFVSFYFHFQTGFYCENVFRNELCVFEPTTESLPSSFCVFKHTAVDSGQCLTQMNQPPPQACRETKCFFFFFTLILTLWRRNYYFF